MTQVKLIWAEARNKAIGRAGEMPWHLPEDLAHFKQLTTGAPVVMGRRTWESLPERFRPLPARENYVVTSDPNFHAPGATVVTSLEKLLNDLSASQTQTVWVMGGGQIYRAVMPHADELVVTKIALEVVDADTFAPEIDAGWKLAESTDDLLSSTGLSYRFERYVRH
jgi:dihydrofolate reductase